MYVFILIIIFYIKKYISQKPTSIKIVIGYIFQNMLLLKVV